MNKEGYLSDPRYAKVYEKMELLGIVDISTKRQSDNGTIVWRLPIKNQWNNGSLIEVASFKTGYVRNQNSCYSNYQLNKCEKSVEYFPDYKWVGDEQVKTGKFNEFVTKKRILIPREIDRLEYLISYCLKNYYIKNANRIADGDYIPKWRYDNLADAARIDYDSTGKIQTLEENLDDAVCTIVKHETKIEELQNKLQSIIRTARH